jgi:serine/threonine protein kinase
LLPRTDHNSSNDESTNHDEILRQRIMMNKPTLAVKFLSDEALYSPEDNCNGSADLLMEAKYLTALASYPHPALIQLHGISRAGPAGFSYPDRAGFFLIIDRLYDTLDRRINIWYEIQRRKTDHKSISGIAPPTLQEIDQIPLYLKALFIQRLVCGYEIISAIAHLHELSIIFRDLKPDNVGFDYYGRVKIFDFGLAKELDPKQQVKEQTELYHMSGGTGSRRYMAPEVSLSEPYGLSADMYSFSILLWELLTLEKAFGRLSVDEHRERVIVGTERPSLRNQSYFTAIPDDSDNSSGNNNNNGWDKDLILVLEGCWRRDPLSRPSSKDIHMELKSIIQSFVQRDFPYKNQPPVSVNQRGRRSASSETTTNSYSSTSSRR